MGGEKGAKEGGREESRREQGREGQSHLILGKERGCELTRAGGVCGAEGGGDAGGEEDAEAGWKLRRRKICSRCLREDKLVRQMITFWHDQGGKCLANTSLIKL